MWSTWKDRDSGELVESYTLLTLNADAHPLMSRMHKPDSKLGPNEQDKRSVVALEATEWDTWLQGSTDEAQALSRLTSVEAFNAGPEALP